MVADCLPILLSELNGRGVAVIHAGWKGLANGVIASTLKNLLAHMPEYGDFSKDAFYNIQIFKALER